MLASRQDDAAPAGLEGTMRRCCEETLRVLRAHKAHLLTIIEVFLHDPLYRWGLTENQAEKVQRDVDSAVPDEDVAGEEMGNADAEQALLRIRYKLDGLDSGAPSPPSSPHLCPRQ